MNIKVNEVKQIRLIDNSQTRETETPTSHWLENDGFDFKVELGNDEVVTIKLLEDEARTQVCTVDDIVSVLESVGLDISFLSQFRIELKETKRWGTKPLFINGTNTVCFFLKKVISERCTYVLMYNTDGTKGIENVYIHGVWRINV